MDYYVDPNGNDSANGSFGAPWRKLSYSVSRLSSGDRLIVNDGVYVERLNSNEIPSGCSILAAGGASPVMYGNLWMTQRQQIVWDGISINGINNGVPTGPGNGEWFNNLYINGCQNIYIRNCEIFNSSKLNIHINDGNGQLANIFLQNLKVHDAGVAGWSDPNVEPAQHNIYISAHFYKTGLIVVDGCEVYNANHAGNGPNQWGIQIYSTDPGYLDGVVLMRNYVHDNRQGIVCGSGSHHKVINNILYNNALPNSYGEAAITIGYGNPCDGILVANNTIVGNKSAYGISNGPWGNPTNTRILNNILWGNGVDSVNEAAGSIADMRGNVFGVDPRFSMGFHLDASSPAIGVGVNLSADFQTDFDGNARPSAGAWDAGALESGVVVVPPPQPPPPPPVQTKVCWDGSVIPIDQDCPPPQPPPPPPVQTKVCWDGSVIPIDQPCPPQPPVWGGHRRPKPKPHGH